MSPKKDTIVSEIYVTIDIILPNTSELNPFYITNSSASEFKFEHWWGEEIAFVHGLVLLLVSFKDIFLKIALSTIHHCNQNNP